MKTVRLGVIGCGGMARAHMAYFPTIPGLKFTAAADPFDENIDLVRADHDITPFDDGQKLIKSGLVDAILICTPHYFHPELSIAGFKAGLHVLTEKPVAVTARDAVKVEAVHAKHQKLVYAAMFQIRAHPLWKRIKAMIDNGELGKLQRMNWIVTNWFRSQAYFNAGAWRATWKGEGGGVLLNQCPHNLDLLCWLLGSPSSVQAQVALGKYHNIEVEDEVTAFLQWKNGMTGVFVTSTGEYPGTDRLEIIGDRGKLTVADGIITFNQTHESILAFSKTTDEAFATPATDTLTIEAGGDDPGHRIVTANFIRKIQKPSTQLICSGQDALAELELGNAMLMSGLTNKPVPIPTNRAAYDRMLKELIKNSTYVKPKVKKAKVDMAKSFH